MVLMSSAGLSKARLARLHDVMAGYIERGEVPGLVALVCRRGETHVEALGTKTLGGSDPVQRDTIFRIASMTKPMTAVAALQLYEQGKLMMDEPLAKYFPKFADSQVAVMDAKKESIVERVPAVRKITIQDLFRHTSGMSYGGRGTTAVHKLYPEGSGQAALAYTGTDFTNHLATLPLHFQPGSTWDYGFGLDVLGLVVGGEDEPGDGGHASANPRWSGSTTRAVRSEGTMP